ncbi:protein tyrosine phosphatase U2 [Microplitis demolitor]|uniref:receptor-type tyrosine-protein phosphatase S n=1 Tax=Microplitis demolitor TaxID=69319 RepID=UPI0004400410|nr:receptor-type tyrosine-protein phosphatase S [Microplitis demolitor]KAG6558345.1 protein tyrosine phosphatase U2 [Microplitis demolitor]
MGCSNSAPLDRKTFTKLMRHKNITEILRKEYQQARCEGRNLDSSFKACQKKENKSKNREENMLCYDHNRVILPIEDNAGDYINANYVDGWKQKGKFICTQGPLKNTAADFWRLIMMHRTRIIVMLSKNSDKECYEYWDICEGGVKSVKNFKIETVKVMAYPNYNVTILNVSDGGKEPLEVIHFACIDWSDFCSVDGVIDFFNFLFDVKLTYRGVKKELLDKTSSICVPPIVVHCSSGLSATAVFCAMDISMSEYLATGTISLQQTAINICKQRYNSFFSVNDYIFYNLLMFRCVTLLSVEKYNVRKPIVN